MTHASQKFRFRRGEFGNLIARERGLMCVLDEALCLTEPLPNAFDEQEVLFSRNGDGAEVQIVLRPKIGVERGASAGSSPEFFRIGEKDFEEWKGVRQRSGWEPIRRRAHKVKRAIARALKHRVPQRRQYVHTISFPASARNISSTPAPALALVSKVGQPISVMALPWTSHRSRRSALFTTRTNGSGPS